MTKRAVLIAFLIAALMHGSSSRAEAIGVDDIWDVLEALSGPGPFTGPPWVATSIVCIDQGRRLWFANLPAVDVASPGARRVRPCVYADFRALAVEPKGPYDRVTAKLTEVGVSWELLRPLELGVGAGVAHFHSKGVGTNRFTFTPVRLLFKPLLLFPSLKNSPRAGAVKYFVRETLMWGHLTGANFGVAPNVLDIGFESVTSAGLLIDPVQLILGR